MGKNIVALFELGDLMATPGANAAIMEAGQDPLDLIGRHVTGDWSELDEHDQDKNDSAVVDELKNSAQTWYAAHCVCADTRSPTGGRGAPAHGHRDGLGYPNPRFGALPCLGSPQNSLVRAISDSAAKLAVPQRCKCFMLGYHTRMAFGISVPQQLVISASCVITFYSLTTENAHSHSVSMTTGKSEGVAHTLLRVGRQALPVRSACVSCQLCNM